MTVLERINASRDRLPDHREPMAERPERRVVARWIERKAEQGLPDKDYTRQVAA